jgi:hypothetical protein
MLCYYFSKKYSQPVDQAANNNGTLTVSPIIVGVDNNGNDIVNDSSIFLSLKHCPVTCPNNNALSENSQIIL